MTGVGVWWIGEGPSDTALLETLRTSVEREYGIPAVAVGEAGRPPEGWDPRRRQWSSSRILAWLGERAGAGRRRLLAVTDVDLFIPILTFVFGEAQLGGRAAVVSTARLGSGPVVTDRRLLVERLVKEGVHELGHTFGLIHCHDARCVMARSAGLLGVDGKGGSLCPPCRARLGELLADAEEAS